MEINGYKSTIFESLLGGKKKEQQNFGETWPKRKATESIKVGQHDCLWQERKAKE